STTESPLPHLLPKPLETKALQIDTAARSRKIVRSVAADDERLDLIPIGTHIGSTWNRGARDGDQRRGSRPHARGGTGARPSGAERQRPPRNRRGRPARTLARHGGPAR